MATPLAALLRSWRERSLLSQEQLAARAGVSVRTIRRLETEGTRPHGDSVRLLAEALGLSDAERAQFTAALPHSENTAATVTAAVTGLVPAAGVPRQLPAAPRHFVGRAGELKQLAGVLGEAETQGSAVVTAITGSAGVGKTALALRWGHQMAEKFPDGHLYVNLRGFDPGGEVMDPSVAVRAFLDALELPPQRIPADLDAQAALYRSVLSGRRMLVMLDNARDSTQVRPLLPGTAGCLTVVTSRNQLTGLAADGAHVLNLDLLSTMEARELLARRLGPDRVAAEEQAVDTIVTRCARLPLALAIVTAHANANAQLSLSALAAQLGEAAEQLDVLTGDDPGTDVRAVFSWSYRALGSEATRMFGLLGLNPAPDITAPAAASLVALPLPRTRTLLRELTRASLLGEQTPGRYVLHDLLKIYAAERAQADCSEQERTAALRRLLNHYLYTTDGGSLLVSRQDPIVLPEIAAGVMPEAFADEAEALAWFDAEHRHVLAWVQRAYVAGLDDIAWQLAWTARVLWARRYRWRENATAQGIALAAARRLDDRHRLARSHRHLGLSLAKVGRHDDAHAELNRAMELYREFGDRSGESYVHISLCELYEAEGDYALALGHAQEALALRRTIGDRDGEAKALNAVGWCLTLLGRHEEAIDHCLQGLALLEEIGFPEHQAHTWDTMGCAHHHLGHHQRAIDCFTRSLDIYRVVGHTAMVAFTLDHLGDTHHAMGDHDAARRAWRAALVILDGLDDPRAGRVRAKL